MLIYFVCVCVGEERVVDRLERVSVVHFTVCILSLVFIMLFMRYFIKNNKSPQEK